MVNQTLKSTFFSFALFGAVLTNCAAADLSVINDFKDDALSSSLGYSNNSQITVEQYGENNLALVSQSGSDNTLFVLQQGNENQIKSIQSGDGNVVNLKQYGDRNSADIYQFGSHNEANVEQHGNQYFLVEQYGDFATVNITQY